jgi:hypothetical protein
MLRLNEVAFGLVHATVVQLKEVDTEVVVN